MMKFQCVVMNLMSDMHILGPDSSTFYQCL